MLPQGTQPQAPAHRWRYLTTMAGKLSPAAALKVNELEGFVPKVQHLHTLVEQYAAAKVNPDNWCGNIKRSGEQLKMKLMGVGLDNMSQLCSALAQAAGRAGNQTQKARLLRELVGNLRFQLDLAIRTIIIEDEREKMKEKEAKEAKEAAK